MYTSKCFYRIFLKFSSHFMSSFFIIFTCVCLLAVPCLSDSIQYRFILLLSLYSCLFYIYYVHSYDINICTHMCIPKCDQ